MYVFGHGHQVAILETDMPIRLKLVRLGILVPGTMNQLNDDFMHAGCVLVVPIHRGFFPFGRCCDDRDPTRWDAGCTYTFQDRRN